LNQQEGNIVCHEKRIRLLKDDDAAEGEYGEIANFQKGTCDGWKEINGKILF